MRFRRGDRVRVMTAVQVGYPAAVLIPAGVEGVITDWPMLGRQTVTVAAGPGVLVDVRVHRDLIEPVQHYAVA